MKKNYQFINVHHPSESYLRGTRTKIKKAVMNNYVERRKHEKTSPRLFPRWRGEETNIPSFSLMILDDPNSATTSSASPSVGTGVFDWTTEATSVHEESPSAVGDSEEWHDHILTLPQDALSMNFNDPFASTVMPLDPKATFYLYHYLTVVAPSRNPIDPDQSLIVSTLMPMARADPGIHYAVLSAAAMHHASRQNSPRVLQDSDLLKPTPYIEDLIHYRSHAIHLVNEKLSSTPFEQSSDNTIAAVTILLASESNIPHGGHFKSHLEGLAAMVEKRGGLYCIPRDLARHILLLATKITIIQGKGKAASTFPMIAATLNLSQRKALFRLIHNQSSNLGKAFDIEPLLSFIDRRLLRAVQCFRAITVGADAIACGDAAFSRHDINAFEWFYVSEEYGLASMPYEFTSDSVLNCAYQETCRIALLVYSNTVIWRLTKPSPLLESLVFALVKVMARIDLSYQTQPLTDFLIWVLAMGVHIAADCYKLSLMQYLKMLRVKERFHRYDGFRTCLETFLFVKSIHGQTAREIWEGL